jgi:uncharacterized protein YndB with AHSA1/START domain
METLVFTIEINQPASLIWEKMWSPKGYTSWTSIFTEGSYYILNKWEEGESIRFMSPKNSGMYGKISKIVPHKEMVFTHIGDIVDGQKIAPENNTWNNALESYHFEETKNFTIITAYVDCIQEYKDFMNETFPKALAKLKLDCESI